MGASTDVLPVAATRTGEFGAAIVNVPDSTEVRPALENVMVAPEIGPKLEAVSAEKVATPPVADAAVVPPIVHAPAPVAAVTVAELAVRLPNWSPT